MNYNTIKYYSTVNGDGVRTALFVSGCRLHCEGCFNSAAWDFKSGRVLTDKKINDILKSIEPDYIDGISILGGEPLDDRNVSGVLHVLEKFREKFGDKKDVWLWSGYYIEESMKDENKKKILDMCDYVVDGPFEKDKWEANITYKGSTNQRVLKKNEKGKFIVIG